MNKIRTAVIGYGLSGKVFHAPFVHESQKFELKRVVSGRELEIKNHYPNVDTTQDTEKAFAKDIDLVIIATPNTTHYDLASKSLSAGKHVLIDKPAVLDTDDFRKLISLSNQKKVSLNVFHNRRFDDDFLTMKNLLPKLGSIKNSYISFNRFRPKLPNEQKKWRNHCSFSEGGGVLWDLGPHLIDQALALFGTPLETHGRRLKQGKEVTEDDYFKIEFLYPANHVCTLEAGRFFDFPGPKISLWGDRGSAQFYGMDPQESHLKEHLLPADLNDYRSQRSKDLILSESLGINHYHKKIVSLGYQHFFEILGQNILSGKNSPIIPFQDVIRGLDIIQSLA